jgi:hypothetical protein
MGTLRKDSGSEGVRDTVAISAWDCETEAVASEAAVADSEFGEAGDRGGTAIVNLDKYPS